MGWPLLVHYLLPFPDDVRLERQTLTASLPASQCQPVHPSRLSPATKWIRRT